jgi:hypothetical protein
MSTSDHCYSKNSNNHKLLPACRRCGLLFSNEKKVEEHDILLKSDSGCPKLSQEDRKSRNAPLKWGRITEKKGIKIDNALKAFRKDKVLPVSCTPESMREWIDRNVSYYVGKSNTDRNHARVELSKWLIVFCTLFPRDDIPMNPCESTTASLSTFCKAHSCQS